VVLVSADIARLLTHRCTVLRLETTMTDGAPAYDWIEKATNHPCRLDLAFMRKNKDPAWVQEAGRAPDRNGVWFGLPDTPARSGDRVRITSPPSLTGTFALDGAIDLAAGLTDVNHVEIGCTEVPSTERTDHA
jgi:hypothetical protein